MREDDTEKFMNDAETRRTFNDNIVQEFRADGGRVNWSDPGDIVLLTMTGAKSGQPRLSPLAYFTIDGKMLLVGSFGGAPKDPPWVQNLRANPAAHVEVGTESYDVIARELPPDERDALFDKLVDLAPMSGDYQAKTSRVIPLRHRWSPSKTKRGRAVSCSWIMTIILPLGVKAPVGQRV